MSIFKGIIVVKYFFMDIFNHFVEYFSAVLENLNLGPNNGWICILQLKTHAYLPQIVNLKLNL